MSLHLVPNAFLIAFQFHGLANKHSLRGSAWDPSSMHTFLVSYLLRQAAAAPAAPPPFVVPASSGTFAVSSLLHRASVPSARTLCPWDEDGLVSFPAPTGNDLSLDKDTKYILANNWTITGTLLVPAGAELIFADTSLELTANSIFVQDGALRIGSASCRTSATTKHTITLTGSRDDPSSGEVGHKGIVVTGEEGRIDIFGYLRQPSWSRLALTAPAKSTEFYLQECVEWPVGSIIVVTTTHLVDWRRHNQNEKVEITAVACEMIDYLDDGESRHGFGRVTIASPLKHTHYAERGTYQAEVGLLSRNVVVQGAATDSPPTDPQPDDVVCSSKLFSEVPCNDYFRTGYAGPLACGCGSCV